MAYVTLIVIAIVLFLIVLSLKGETNILLLIQYPIILQKHLLS